MKKRIKIHGFLIFLCAALVLAFPKIFLQLHYSRLNFLTDIPGVIFLIAGFIFRISARGLKAERSQNGNVLVKDGLYSLTRNPMYLGVSLAAFGIILLVFQYWVLILFLLFFAVVYVRLVFQEEKILAQKFGQEYLEYKERVPRFLPRLREVSKNNLPIKREWVYKELSSIAPLAIAILFFKIWQVLR